MDKINLRLLELASEIFESAVPLVEKPFLTETVKDLIMTSSRMGASYYRKNSEEISLEQFNQKIWSSIIDLQETQIWLQILIDKCPDNQKLQSLDMKAKSIMVFLSGMVDEKIAV